jgi:plasmid stabilization system protein ParE
MRRIAWTVEARMNLAAIRTYINDFSPLAAQRFADRLVEVADSLGEFADRGRPIGNARRELTIVWPYIIRYEVTPELVTILRIRHGARRPD